jgi:hypothetical protein
VVTKEELRRRVRLAKFPRRAAAVVHDAPEHNPLVLEDCAACLGSGHRCVEEAGTAVLSECQACAGSGITEGIVPYFNNDAPSRPVRLGDDGWVTCPCCSYRFSPRDANAWSGLRHFRCGQRLLLEPAEALLGNSMDGRRSP